MLSLPQLLSQVSLLSSLLNPQPPLQPSINNFPSISKQNTCPNPPSLSCPSSPSGSLNTCCVNHPSGHFLQTQFWDTSPPIGPNNSWTIHGLWPDLCSGGFDAFCDNTRSHPDIRSVLRHALEEDDSSNSKVHELIQFMETYWLSYDGNDEHLWSHEWNKHGTCISTLEPDCYPSSSEVPTTSTPHHHVDVLDYFIHTTSLFRTLDTYALLTKAGILPSHDKSYTLRDLEDAISSSSHGQPVTFRCNRKGELDEIWYHFSVMGSLQHSGPPHSTGPRTPNNNGVDRNEQQDSPFLNASSVRKHFIPAPPDGILSNCPRRGIKYLPKTPNDNHPAPSPTGSRTRTHPPTASPTNTSPPFTGKGHLEIHILDSDSTSSSPPLSNPATLPATQKKGCLITHGPWYISGSCATFRSQPDIIDPGHQPLFSLSSSFSPCLINPATKRFECTKEATIQGIFSSSVEDESVLAYRNGSVFWAEKVPGRFEKVDVFADDGEGEREVRVEIRWVAV